MMPGSDQIAKKENIRTMTEYEVHYLGTRPYQSAATHIQVTDGKWARPRVVIIWSIEGSC
jgi:hypothetical protein